MKKIVSYFLVILFFTHTVSGQEWLWKIKPFEMKITDLNDLIDSNPENYRSKKLKYKLKEGNLFVYYSNEKCSPTDWGEWDISEGTIVGMTFYPRKKRKIAYYKLNNTQMNKSFDDVGTEVYTNDEKGLLYTVYSGRVNQITFYPSQRFEKLRCAK